MATADRSRTLEVQVPDQTGSCICAQYWLLLLAHLFPLADHAEKLCVTPCQTTQSEIGLFDQHSMHDDHMILVMQSVPVSVSGALAHVWLLGLSCHVWHRLQLLGGCQLGWAQDQGHPEMS